MVPIGSNEHNTPFSERSHPVEFTDEGIGTPVLEDVDVQRMVFKTAVVSLEKPLRDLIAELFQLLFESPGVVHIPPHVQIIEELAWNEPARDLVGSIQYGLDHSTLMFHVCQRQVAHQQPDTRGE